MSIKAIIKSVIFEFKMLKYPYTKTSIIQFLGKKHNSATLVNIVVLYFVSSNISRRNYNSLLNLKKEHNSTLPNTNLTDIRVIFSVEHFVLNMSLFLTF